MHRFNNKIALVTGAGQGIGFEICRQLATEGGRVYLNDIDAPLAEQAAEKIRESGGTCTALAGDSSDLVFIHKMVSTIIEQNARLDIAIANAGITVFGDFFEYTPEAFERVVQVNLFGTFFLAQAAATQMQQQPEGGSLLFMSSVTGHQAHKDLAAYSMTKAAIEMLAKNLVVELGRYKINVNAIAPGATLTERTLSDPHYAEVWSKVIPAGRAAVPADIAQTALFLVSDQAKHINGQSLIVDGGWSATSPLPF